MEVDLLLRSRVRDDGVNLWLGGSCLVSRPLPNKSLSGKRKQEFYVMFSWSIYNSMPTPLPPNHFPTGELHVAYQRCLALEAAAPRLRAPTHCPPPIICARILGHLLRLASANGQGQVQRQITSAESHAMLMELAGLYMRHFICTFRRRRGPTPPPTPPDPWNLSPPPSPSSGDVGMAITQDSVDYYDSQATVRSKANSADCPL
ncbi:hypothetical protein BKA82DRAFT_607360 [Pisolithus tinctorius]|uniref:Uncharacterized protein n=1 Tax=Pisolithus tinctorius Marx 270 TaxID=870435 RepID=A0A0C3P8P1_PISTI|nr:hypothetical protein BKA82DRAFT_607360 [Pisolithus tinctorius]KIO03834.1 hypothetical protein M404DRAFT_607360 [Pisolithus tinctorius Marx 270]